MKAFDLDSTTVDLSGYYTWSLWDWEKGEKEFKRVIERNPNDAQSKAVYSHLLAILGRNEEALAQIEIAVKLDPLNEFIKVFYGVVLTFVSKYDEAIEAFKDALKIEPNYPFAQGNFGVALVLSGRYKEAVEQWKFCNAVDIELVNALEEGYNEGGFKGALLSYNNVVESRYKNSFWSPIDIAMNYAMIGDKDKALFWLETGFQIRDPNTPYLLLPVFDNLRDDTRFQDLCKRMNLPYK
jgi:tetratricopeptide (TPR) repeat protein